MIVPALVAVLVAGGTYLLLQRSMVRAVFGISLLSHAGNLVLLAAGVTAWRGDPLLDRTAAADAADPLPQAFVLTAIVITFAASVIMLALAVIGHDDDTGRHPETGEEHDR